MMNLHRTIVGMVLLWSCGIVQAQTTSPGLDPFYKGQPVEMGAHDVPTASDLSTLQERVRIANNRRSGATARATGKSAQISDLVAGSTVFDLNGAVLGQLERLDGKAAIVATSTGKVAVPADAFGRNKHGLLLDVSKDQFDTMVAAAAGKRP